MFQVSGLDIRGSLPSHYSSWDRVQQLILADNHLFGSLPASWSRMTNLQSLQLGSNALTGTIPKSLSGMTSLKLLNLMGNPDLACPEDGGTLLSSVPDNIARALEASGFVDPCPRDDEVPTSNVLYISIGAVGGFVGLSLVVGLTLLIVGTVHALRCKNPSCRHRHPGMLNSFAGYLWLL
mmetsp:Transcript_22356/g.61989  ORF Transcript_22356/g.61989 Transcript_22356/m.61989 type:complete len:180 (-) Transcript_22356:432-971(-)